MMVCKAIESDNAVENRLWEQRRLIPIFFPPPLPPLYPRPYPQSPHSVVSRLCPHSRFSTALSLSMALPTITPIYPLPYPQSPHSVHLTSFLIASPAFQ